MQGYLIPNSSLLFREIIQPLNIGVPNVTFVAIFVAMPAHPAMLNFLRRRKMAFGRPQKYTSSLLAHLHRKVVGLRHHMYVTIAWYYSIPLELTSVASWNSVLAQSSTVIITTPWLQIHSFCLCQKACALHFHLNFQKHDILWYLCGHTMGTLSLDHFWPVILQSSLHVGCCSVVRTQVCCCSIWV